MTQRPSQMSQDLARAMNLLAHPMAGWAAASAVGLGMATQAWGLWMGAVAGAIENAQQLSQQPSSENKPDAGAVASSKARMAAETLMADAQSLAREVARPAPQRPAAKRSRPVAKAARADAGPAPAASLVKPAAGSMVQPRSLERPDQPDDLKAISGVGPKLEQVLNGMGVWTWAQIADWTSAELAWVDDQLGFSGRILRDDWVGQAKRLVGEPRNG